MMKLNLSYFLPELVLIGTIFALFATDLLSGLKKSSCNSIYPRIALAGFAGMMVANYLTAGLAPAHFFSGMVTFDAMAHFFKYLFATAGLLGVSLSQNSPEVEGMDQSSYYTLLTALVLGMSLLATSNHLLMIYLSLEIVSILSYILTGYTRGVRRSSEAALKYVIYGGVASGIMAYGISLLYGLTGTMDLPTIAAFLKANPVSRAPLYLSVLLMMAGFGYKIASFPFHAWCPDVYEGAPTPFTAFLSIGPKAAGFAILIRFFWTALTTQAGDASFADIKLTGWPEMMALLSMATMTIGNLAALVQHNAKRLLAYSSIAHAGYMLMGFAALNQESLSAILFYMVVYIIMNSGTFLVVILLSNQFGVEDIEDYKGLSRRGGLGLFMAFAMAIFLFSLTGIPPMAGFAGKFYLFGAVIRSGRYGLALVGVLNSVVSLYYYVRIIKYMFFDEPTDERQILRPAFQHSVVLSGLAVLTLYFGLFWNHLAQVVIRSSGLYY